MKKIILIFLFALAAFCISAKEIILKVVDRDIDIPLEGVKVLDKESGKNYFTDKSGSVRFLIADSFERVILNINLIGYENKLMNLKEFDKEVIVKLSIGGVLEGKELVIEEKSIGKKDEQVGVSKVIDKEDLKSTAEIGIVEDVFSSIKMLPGVSFAGGFDTQLSIRGGEFSGLTCLYDGFLVRYPFHFGGGFSIFNPNVVESVKFSPGIFSAKHGLTTSALMEVDNYKPEQGLKFNTLLSSSTFEAFLQTPIGLKDAGLLIGTRISYFDLYTLMTSSTQTNTANTQNYTTSPHIRDAYLKWYWKPDKRVEWYAEGMFISDGMEMEFNYYPEHDNTLKNKYKDRVENLSFENKIYSLNIDSFGFTGLKILPNDNIFMNFFAGYEYWFNGFNFNRQESGRIKYSDEFKAQYGGLLGGATDFDLKDNIKANFYSNNILHSIQTRYDTDIKLHERILMSVGIGGFYDFLFFEGGGKTYSILYESGMPTYKRIDYKMDAEDKKYLKYFGYISFKFNIVPDVFDIEAGCRIDHLFLYAESFKNGVMNMYPAPSPRLLFTYSPVRNLIWLEKLTLTAGVGLFSKMDLNIESGASGKYDINDFDIPMSKSLSTVAGIEFQFPYGYKFKTEGYYKFAFDRTYLNYNPNAVSEEYKYYVNRDGIGHMAGFEVSFERKISKYIDGMISYSFVYARFKNPSTNNIENSKDIMSGAPNGIWYYPSYHRFHIFNMVINIRPVSFLTITPSFKVTSGVPKNEVGEKIMFPAALSDGTIIEMYSREEVYSDTLRSDISIPFNLKIAFNVYFPKSKIRFEGYIGVEDLFAFLYTPKKEMETNKYTGEDTQKAVSGFGFNIPIPSLGIKLSF